MRIDIAHVAQIAEMLADYADDDEAFLDTLDGETDVLDWLDNAIARQQDDATMAAAIKAREDDLRARRQRIETRTKGRRDVMLAVMKAVGKRKIERPEATLAVQKPRQSVVIYNESEVPSQLCRVVKTPDKTAIKAQLDAGADVPGAGFAMGDETLMVRTK